MDFPEAPEGLHIKAGSRLINAHSESILDKPSFRRASVKRRALGPAEGYYEWQKTKDGKKIPDSLYSAKDDVLAFVGLYEFWLDPSGGVIVIRPARGRYDQGGDRADEPDQRGSTAKKSSGFGLKASGLEAVSADTVTVSGASVVLGVTLALGVTLG